MFSIDSTSPVTSFVSPNNQSKESKQSLSTLPEDGILHALSFLDEDSSKASACVSKKFKELTKAVEWTIFASDVRSKLNFSW